MDEALGGEGHVTSHDVFIGCGSRTKKPDFSLSQLKDLENRETSLGVSSFQPNVVHPGTKIY